MRSGKSLTHPTGTWRAWLWLLATTMLTVVGVVLTRHSVALPATTWMHMFAPSDFPTVRDLVTFLRELRVPIPPILAALEIISFQQTGWTAVVTVYLYRASLVGTYVLAVWWTYPSLYRLVASLIASLVFLSASTVIHPLNPQVYDLVFPFTMLLCLILLRLLRDQPANRIRTRIVLAAGCGFFLSMAELTRPFVFLLLPLLFAGAYLGLRPTDRRLIAALLAPFLLFSGLWHLHLFAAHRQILSTNYSGFNLYRAWPQAPLGAGAYASSTQSPPDQRWPSFNDDEHTASSRYLQRAVLAYIVANPTQAASEAVRKIGRFVLVRTSMYGGRVPADRGIVLYKILAPLSFVFLLANVGVLGWYAAKAVRRAHLILAEPDNLLLLVTLLSVLIVSLGEVKEEARLVLSLLPFLAGYPIARPAAPRDSALRG